MLRPTLLAAVVIHAGFAGALLAQDNASPPGEDPVLKGPAVPDNVARTLIVRDARGNFRRVEGRPEEAAIVVLGLEGKTREKAVKICNDRANAIGMLLAEHVDLVKEATDAQIAGKTADVAKTYARLREFYEPAPVRDPLAKGMSELLKPTQRAELDRLLNEYWAAAVDWELRNAKEKGPEARAKAEERLVFQIFQDEVRLAYERVLKPYRDRLEGVYAALEPTPEQRAQIRDVVLDLIREGKLKPTPEQRRAAMTRIYATLDEERKAKLFDLIVRQVVPND